MSRPVLFLDLDGTVRHGRDELGHFVNTADDVVIYPEARKLIHKWRVETWGAVIGVTNQAGVALGHISQEEHERITRRTWEDAVLDRIVSCTHAPDAGCCCRKPKPGLIDEAIAWLRASGWHYDPTRSSCLMVGDRLEDEGAAKVAGIPFQWAADWRASAT